MQLSRFSGQQHTGRSTMLVCDSKGGRAARQSRLCCTALRINRRHHLELQWQRQQQEEQLLATLQPPLVLQEIQEIKNLAHLERVLEVSGGALCVLAFYSRSCGICRDVMGDFRELWGECKRQNARVAFLTHNVLDEFDYPSDVARMYNVKTVPRFLFLVDGAVVRQVCMADARQWRATRDAVQARLREDRQRLRQVLRELLFKNAPSARR